MLSPPLLLPVAAAAAAAAAAAVCTSGVPLPLMPTPLVRRLAREEANVGVVVVVVDWWVGVGGGMKDVAGAGDVWEEEIRMGAVGGGGVVCVALIFEGGGEAVCTPP